MRTWTRARDVTICGGPCQQLVAKGDPVLEIRIKDVQRVHVRCGRCAGEPVPAHLPALEERPASVIVPTYKPTREFASIGKFATDFKARQLPREPGEDDV